MNIVLVTNTASSMWSNTLEVVGLLLLFCFILGASYFATRFVGNFKLRNLKNKNFEIIETMKLTPNKYLQVVRMGNRYVVISIGKDDVRYITELNSDEVILPEEKNETTVQFSEVLEKLKRKMDKK